jgi:NDP-sugar pyrophosphorylase family protein
VVKRAVILAGGKGSRLGPLTTILPKPLMPLGDRAILDVVIQQLAARGFSELVLAVGHLAHLIRAVIGDGSSYGLKIRYHEEAEPAGTAGALAGIDGLEETFLMMNGDVLTTLDYGALFQAHRQTDNALTIATHRRVVRTDYGVVHVDAGASPVSRVAAYEEKPELDYTVSMGVYVVEPRCREYVPTDKRFDFPDLVTELLAAEEPVGAFMFDGYWLDIGRPDDYEQALEDYPALLPQLFSDAGPEA